MSQFSVLAKKMIIDATKLKVVSYHDPNGKIIHNCTKPNGELKSIDGVTAPNHRPADVLYCKIKVDLVFTHLDDSTILYPYSFFMRLLQTSVEVTDSTGRVVVPDLHTFHGADNWIMLANQANFDVV